MTKQNNGILYFFLQTNRQIFQYLKDRWSVLLVFLIAFAACTSIIYLDASTSQTIASYSIEEYETGMIADKTIISSKSIPPDEQFPIAIEEGEKIIRKGFPITDEDYLKLQKMAASPSYIDYRAFADKVLFLMLVSALAFLLFSKTCLGHKIEFKEVFLTAFLFVVVFFASAFGDKAVLFQNLYKLPVIIPSALCVALVSILFGQIFGLYFSILISFGVLCATGFELIPFLFTLTSSLTLVRIVHSIERRIDMIFSSIGIAVLNIVYICVLKVIFNDSFSDAFFVLSGLAFNGFISGIIVLGLLTPLEIIMNTASVFRLMDLSDQNAPVLRKLLLTASGTYQHSIMVSQLAESACKEIGANFLLARVASLYHDIGKMEHPEYFTENNIDTENKHTDLNPSLSVSIIKSHIRISVEKAHQLHLPSKIIDIIAEHHGNSVITYFYNKAKSLDPNVSEAEFRYDGNLPSTKESAVVMLADGVEAACKSLEKPTAPRLEKFISQIINAKIENHQLDDCSLTFGELTKIKNSFVSILAAYYHGRIKYQNQKDPDETSSTEEKTSEVKKDE
ncbi:HD family phosphohydrolase [Treponema pectinovorum]|uniref:HD family phosphohydrolase n=1 Tax=Treponema pectinovorum TaxID=164 RepID=UPI0011C911B5|nr:HDIG domain-containing metalloprotein [Treponema pectinovorum]